MVEVINSPTSLKIYHRGPNLDAGAFPTLFYFALSGNDSLSLDPFNQPVAHLQQSPLRIFSFDLPFHVQGDSYQTAMDLWAKAFAEGDDFLTLFLNEVNLCLSFLIEQRYVDPNSIGVAGLSRGGFIATLLAAQDARIKTILGFAPLTRFGWMHHSHSKLSNSFDLENHIHRLVGKYLRFYIGNRDLRVGTSVCYDFIRVLTDASFDQGIRSPQVELIISPSIGHKGHGTSQDIFHKGSDWIKNRLLNGGHL